MSEANRRTTARRELARHDNFEQISPEVGELDENAFDDAMDENADDALAMLADLTGATDQKLKALARRLAGRIVIDVARRGAVSRSGIGRLARQRYRPDGGDLDLDTSVEPVFLARATGSLPDVDELRVVGWVKPTTAWCLLVDRSGSMGGRPLATSAVAAASIAWRSPDDYSVVAFSNEAIVAKSQDTTKPAERVVNDVLSLRGFGTTDVALALRTAQAQLARSRAGRKVTVLLSDCRATADGDVERAARGLDELVIIAPETDHDEADALGRRVGARVVTVAGPSEIPAALERAFNS